MSDHSVILPPTSIDAEMGVLGALLTENSIIGDVLPKLDKSYFFSRTNQFIFEAISQLYQENKPIDIISVQEYLKKNGISSDSDSYLLNLMATTYSAGNVYYYVEVLREKGIVQLLIQAAQEVMDLAKDWRMDLSPLLDIAEKKIFSVTQRKLSNDPVPIQMILGYLVPAMKEAANKFEGVKSGFGDLDQVIKGFANSSLNIVAARPSMGKTSFALNIAIHAALEQKIGVLIFSLEMSKEQLVQNMLCSRTQIDSHKIGVRTLNEEECDRINIESNVFAQSYFFIDDTPGLTLADIRGKARRYKLQHKVGLIILDYIQLMECGQSGGENRQQEISQISRGLKAIAREINVPIIALSQLNRSVDSRDDHHPRMSDLRESGALEQDADLILFLYRDEYYNKNSSKQGIAEVVIGKNRNGPTGSIELCFFKQFTRFVSISRET